MTVFAIISLAIYAALSGYGLFIIFDGVARGVRSYFARKRRFPSARIVRRRKSP